LNIVEIKKLHQDLMKRLEEQKKKDTEFELFWVEKKNIFKLTTYEQRQKARNWATKT